MKVEISMKVEQWRQGEHWIIKVRGWIMKSWTDQWKLENKWKLIKEEKFNGEWKLEIEWKFESEKKLNI